jgi:hypothetical protein
MRYAGQFRKGGGVSVVPKPAAYPDKDRNATQDDKIMSLRESGAHPLNKALACSDKAIRHRRTPSGDWSVALQSRPPHSASGVTVPASSGQNAALDAVICALIDGDPVIGEAKAPTMRNGWRK